MAILFDKFVQYIKLGAYFSSNYSKSFDISNILQISAKLFAVSYETRSYPNSKKQQVNYKAYWTYIQKIVFQLLLSNSYIYGIEPCHAGTFESIFSQAKGLRAKATYAI